MANVKLKAVKDEEKDSSTVLTLEDVNEINANIGKARAVVDLISSVQDIETLCRQTLGWVTNESLYWLDKADAIINRKKKAS